MRKQKDSSTVRLRSPQASLSGTILQKLSTLEDLLKKKDDKPLTFKEACAYLGYAPSYLYKLTYRKIIPHYKPTGKMVFFSKNELDQWIFKSSVERRVKSNELENEMNAVKDPNSPRFAGEAGQMEMELNDASTGSAQGHEIVVEFPRKKRK